MTDRPIIFSAPMVKALLSGRKTVTRRLINPEPPGSKPGTGSTLFASGDGAVKQITHHFRPKWRAGDRLWCREAWRSTGDGGRADDLAPSRLQPHGVWYEADGHAPDDGCVGKLRPSIFMPRWASRLTLLVTDVKVERLQDISEADAVAEGIELEAEPFEGRTYFRNHDRQVLGGHLPARASFSTLWSSIHGAESWNANPWVAAISFRVHRANIDTLTPTDALTAGPGA